jgi:hypothetical protein
VSQGACIFDGQSVRIEFCVTRRSNRQGSPPARPVHVSQRDPLRRRCRSPSGDAVQGCDSQDQRGVRFDMALLALLNLATDNGRLRRR